jgi:ABC-type cobalamin/Fe3+-siderophores transport system ATPase subunit
MAVRTPKLNLPTLRRITLRRFSLFSSAPAVDETLNPGVFCLAGANGLGKSTFLAAVNFAITGLVPDPGLKFRSVEEYYRHGLDFAREYFRGRINEEDREAAEVSVELTAGAHAYELTRAVFETDELRALTIRDATSPSHVVLDGSELSEGERHQRYAEHLTKDIGLGSFEQFVFLQHFVFTFDERRHLLFWDPSVLEQALFLAFGVDYGVAKRADSLRREAERADSLARNANWQATEVRKKIKDLESTAEGLSSENAADLVAEHKALSKDIETAERSAEKAEGQQRDLSLQLAALSSKQSSLRAQYEEEFARRIRTTMHVSHHPLVVDSIKEATCALCGAHGNLVTAEIRSRTETKSCPLCGSKVEKDRARPKDVARLKELDEALLANKAKLAEVSKGLARLDRELPHVRDARTTANERLRAFEKENYSLLVKRAAHDKGTGVAAVLDAYHAQMAEFLEAKKKQYQRRDERKRELRRLQDELEVRYSAAEEEFVPMFKELAFRFLGLDLDVRMDASRAPAILVLQVKNEARREHHQLSESQKFFIDIALRMALAQFMSATRGEATLFIDTPEGSLDIAYENRAGEMLAMFVERGFHIVMTANINSSRLLFALANTLGRSRMQLCRMTSWAELSEVQQQEEALFEDAYSRIEKALEKSTRSAGHEP